MKRQATHFILLALILLLATGCHTTKKVTTDIENHTKTETKTAEKGDTLISQATETTIISQRPTDVEVEIPQAHLERETSDTTSVLETDLYRSTATIKNGKLHHTLESIPGAKVKGQAIVSDTTKTKESITVQKTKDKTNHEATQTDTKEKEIDKTVTRWPWWIYALIATAIAALSFYIFRAIKK